MPMAAKIISSQVREELLSSAAHYGNNSLWNYVSILSWLRVMRVFKILMLIFPAVFGGLASWYAVHTPQNANSVAAFAALAGFFPIVFVALGLDERIAYYREVAGKYRLIHALFENISNTSTRFEDEALEKEYDRAFGEYCRVREQAHTVPRWCFVRAKREIEAGEYSLIRRDSGGAQEQLSLDNLKTESAMPNRKSG